MLSKIEANKLPIHPFLKRSINRRTAMAHTHPAAAVLLLMELVSSSFAASLMAGCLVG